jgi:hypothetical protein
VPEQITDRELGAAIQELAEVRHGHRNLRQIVNLLADQQERMRIDQAKLHTKLTTVASIGLGLFAFVGWLIDRFA